MENQKITTGAPVADNIIIYSPPQPSPRFGAVAEWLAVKSDATGTCMKDVTIYPCLRGWLVGSWLTPGLY
jgi:hypothetical protein